MYKCIFKVSRKEYKELKSKGLILPTDDVYKAYDYRKRIVYTVYRFSEEKREKQ
jgi:hypothetical protein